MSAIIFGEFGERDLNALKLETRRKRHIPNSLREEMAPEQLKAVIALDRSLCPGAELRSITAKYNCMGMAFASRRTNIDIRDIDLIFQDDEYARLNSEADAEVGDIVVYHGPNDKRSHVGVIVELKQGLVDRGGRHRLLKVLSKWGGHGEYAHMLDQIPPDYGRPAEFWTDRRLL
ncbi:MAG: hypothetical protein Q7S58_13280 [Candidatus Binatus sp.]|uniref:hypothetical protein n=1 Tax=Candidatus Binatus sp. TaxID=2811406 RepID=UPI0027243AD2|nr:hypothetical protein [Candidatus Binatus sp.]MDO8433370.1 hypothetical protein [Candidatus Binatus sp.]